jgi:HTH-type transcriptional regulator, sugar sensing transcriptional regulator
MGGNPIERLMTLGFSEYEAKTYMALLGDSPATGYQISKSSGVPRSMIYEVLGKLVARGAAMTLHSEGGNKYAPVAASEFLDELQREHEMLVTTLKDDLKSLGEAPTHEHVWNIGGNENVMAKAREMIDQSRVRLHLALLPETFPALKGALSLAVERGVRVVVHSTDELELPGARVVVSPVPEIKSDRIEGLWLVLAVDGCQAMIGELLTQNQARASWTRSPLFVFVAEHHLRTDLYLPRILSLLGDKAVDFIDEADRDLFATPFESRIDC